MTTRTRRLATGLATLAIVAGALPAVTAAADPVEIKWFCCLGTGDNMDYQVPVEQQVVDDWNAAHPEIHVTLEVVPNVSAKDTLLTENAAGNPPAYGSTTTFALDRVAPATGTVAVDPDWLSKEIGTPVVEGMGAPLHVAAGRVRL